MFRTNIPSSARPRSVSIAEIRSRWVVAVSRGGGPASSGAGIAIVAVMVARLERVGYRAEKNGYRCNTGRQKMRGNDNRGVRDGGYNVPLARTEEVSSCRPTSPGPLISTV